MERLEEDHGCELPCKYETADHQALIATMEVRDRLNEIGVGTNLPIVERVCCLEMRWLMTGRCKCEW